jgi:hypothetical protein
MTACRLGPGGYIASITMCLRQAAGLIIILLSAGCVMPARTHESAGPSSARVDPSPQVSRRLKEVKECYEQLLQHNPTASGEIILRWTIKTDGSTDAVEVERDTLGGAVGTCIASLLARWKFPAPREPTEVSFPFRFTATL